MSREIQRARLCDVPVILDYVRRLVRHDDPAAVERWLLDGGERPWGCREVGGSSSPCGHEYWYDSKGPRYSPLTPDEEGPTLRWHRYCDEHGYPGAGDRSGYPPPPPGRRGPWFLMTWDRVRHELIAARTGGEQMTLTL